MTSETIQIIRDPKEEAMRDYISQQKCPFRIYKQDNYERREMEYLMPCDPDCMAILYEQDYSAYSCLRLINLKKNIENTCFASVN